MEKESTKNKIKGVMSGVVISSSNGCAIVRVDRLFKHPKYGKYISRSKRLKAVDVFGKKPGEIVELLTSRPVSKGKRFKIL